MIAEVWNNWFALPINSASLKKFIPFKLQDAHNILPLFLEPMLYVICHMITLAYRNCCCCTLNNVVVKSNQIFHYTRNITPKP